MYPHRFGLALRAQLAAGVLEVADQLLLFGVDRDGRLAGRHRRLHDGVDVGELGVALGVVRPFPGLAVGLAAVAQLSQQQANQLLADLEAALAQGPDDLALAAADPTQRRLRVTADRILDQRLQCRRQVRLQDNCALAPTTRASDPPANRIGAALQLHDRPPDRAARQPARRRRRRHPAMANRQGFVRRKQPPATLIEELAGLLVPRADVVNVDHPVGLLQRSRGSAAPPGSAPANCHHV